MYFFYKILSYNTKGLQSYNDSEIVIKYITIPGLRWLIKPKIVKYVHTNYTWFKEENGKLVKTSSEKYLMLSRLDRDMKANRGYKSILEEIIDRSNGETTTIILEDLVRTLKSHFFISFEHKQIALVDIKDHKTKHTIQLKDDHLLIIKYSNKLPTYKQTKQKLSLCNPNYRKLLKQSLGIENEREQEEIKEVCNKS